MSRAVVASSRTLMITVHHLNNSRSQRVLWLLEELGLAYEVKRYERDAKTMLAPPELRAVHPLGKSPVITDDHRTVAESGAIIEYLVGRYGAGRLRPAEGTNERLRYDYWLHYAEGSAMTPLLLKLIFDLIPGQLPAILRPIGRMVCTGIKHKVVEPQLKNHFDYMESELVTHGPWFAGPEFTAADIQMSFPVEVFASRGGPGAVRPRLEDFLEKIHARPAYQRALERGGPYALLK